MATTYKTPGVYIEEIPKFPPSVAQVETAIPIFIGYTEKRGVDGAALPTATIDAIAVTEAKRITSLLEYETYFGKGVNETFTVTIDEIYTTDTPSVLKKRVIKANVATPSIHTLYYNMQMYFANGGGPCYIISVGNTTETAISKTNLIAGLKMAEKFDEPTLLVFPQAVNIPGTTGAGEAYDVYDAALLQAGALQDRFVLIDCYGDDAATLRDSTAGIGITYLKYGAAYHPFLRTSLNYQYNLSVDANFTISYRRDLNDDGDFTDTGEAATTPAYSALSTELKSLVKLELDKQRVNLPPSSTVAGVYALVDSTRGVWKAPANVSLQLVNGLTKQVTQTDQAGLNVDTDSGKSINAIRAFTGKGILIWGARTRAGNDNEWRYVSVPAKSTAFSSTNSMALSSRSGG